MLMRLLIVVVAAISVVEAAGRESPGATPAIKRSYFIVGRYRQTHCKSNPPTAASEPVRSAASARDLVATKSSDASRTAVTASAKTAAVPAVGRESGRAVDDQDTDGDGVPDKLEREGYTYDRTTGRFKAWDSKNEPNAKHWFTDPLQWSTDQDAYSDGMEASGAVMDVAVRAPGSDPLVPAYPNIVVELAGYSVTLNEEITYDEGKSLAKGTTWNRETVQTSSLTAERNWEAGVETTLEASATGAKGSVSAHLNIGGSVSGTQTASNAMAVGGSVLDETNWSCARTTNPTDAARIKLRVKVHNFGTACASNVVPTLTLRIGGINVETFEPGAAQVNLLVPGAVYPPDAGVYWVVDSIDTGVGVMPLSLTLDELRALERGAPISISVTQLKADVMMADRAKGWSPAGDVNEYLARCNAVSTNLRVEMTDGSFVHYLVFAGDGLAAPRLKLGDALRRIGVGADGLLAYTDVRGTPQKTALAGYAFVFDRTTLSNNGWNLDSSPAAPPAGFAINNMVLGPGTAVYAKAPRTAADVGPKIYYANFDAQTSKLAVCVSDYQGIKAIKCLDKDGRVFRDETGEKELAMTEELSGSGFYQAIIPESDYAFDGTERVVVTNLANQSAERPVNIVYYEKPPQPEKPVINSARIDWKSQPPRVYANVTNPQPTFPLQWIRIFHPRLTKGYIDMVEAAERYKDPNGWEAKLENGIKQGDMLKVVAYVVPGCYNEAVISDLAIAELASRGDWSGKHKWAKAGLDFDTGNSRTAKLVDQYPKAYPTPIDLTFSWHGNYLLLRFNGTCVSAPGDENAFKSLDKQGVEELLKRNPAESMLRYGPGKDLEGLMFVLETDLENKVKFRLHIEEPTTRNKATLKVSYLVYPRHMSEPQTEK